MPFMPLPWRKALPITARRGCARNTHRTIMAASLSIRTAIASKPSATESKQNARSAPVIAAQRHRNLPYVGDLQGGECSRKGGRRSRQPAGRGAHPAAAAQGHGGGSGRRSEE